MRAYSNLDANRDQAAAARPSHHTMCTAAAHSFAQFDVVPAECVTGTRLGFYIELVCMLLLPPAAVVFVLVVARLSVVRLSSWDGRLRSMFHTSRVYKALTWIYLLVYPSVARKTLITFDCVSFASMNEAQRLRTLTPWSLHQTQRSSNSEALLEPFLLAHITTLGTLLCL